MLTDSRLLNDLQRLAYSPAGHPMYVYGDLTYPLRVNLQAPFRNAVMALLMEAFNQSMITVKFMDFRRNLKIGLSIIGRMYVVCAMLRNALICLYGNQTSSFFQLEPPSLEEYFY